jgi:plastocyanin
MDSGSSHRESPVVKTTLEGFMTFRYSRTLVLGALAACLALLAAIPALASSSKTKATAVTATVTKAAEFKFKLSKTSVPHGAVTIKFVNQGQLPHNFHLCSSNKGGTAVKCAGKGTPTISGGATATLKVTLTKPGKYEYLCEVPGHAAAGMRGILTVK